jgi:hypothetical protein
MRRIRSCTLASANQLLPQAEQEVISWWDLERWAKVEVWPRGTRSPAWSATNVDRHHQAATARIRPHRFGLAEYLARPDVLAILQTEYLSQLSRAQVAARKFAGGIDMSTGREWPDWTTPEWVDFHTYKELQRAANQTRSVREQAQLRAARPTPSPQPEAARQEEAVLTDPDIMTHWSPSKEDLESMERVLKRAKANEPVGPVSVPDLPWLPPGPGKVVALLRRAADPKGRVSISQNTIVTI